MRPRAPNVPQPKAPTRHVLTPPLHLATAVDEDAQEKLQRYEQEQGRQLVQGLRGRVRAAIFMSKGATNADGTQLGDDALISQQHDYLEGWATAMVRTAPTLADDLAAEIESALCDPETSSTESLAYVHLAGMMPELSSSAGYDCVFTRHPQEDALLWQSLDVLRESGLPMPPSLEAIAARATDERTLSRIEALRAADAE